jgi:predicted acylesterase/phospholipase RssA
MQRVDISNFNNKKVALVLSGGVVKAAAWHLGVALALEELGFTFKSNQHPNSSSLEISSYVGSSVGAMVNLYFASGYKPIEIIESYIEKPKNPKIKALTYSDMLSMKSILDKPKKPKFFSQFDSFPSVIRALISPIEKIDGLFTIHGVYKYIKENILISNDFNDYKADLFIVATQLDHSRKVIFSKYNYPNPSHDSTSVYYTDIPVAESIAASMSVPPVYRPFPIKNNETGQVDYYIDGEIRETLSTHVALDNSCEFIISSWTHTPYHFHDEIGSLVNYGLPTILLQTIHLAIQKKIITSRAKRSTAVDIINTVSDYMKTNKFSNIHRKKICNILERKLDFNPKAHFIDIYPKSDSYKMFFKNPFSLDPDKMSELISLGYKRTIEIFNNHEYES